MTGIDTAGRDPSAPQGRHGRDADGDELVERPEDDDYDLLTFGEAGARLSEEIVKQRRVIATLRAGSAAAETVAAAQARLDALIDAQVRNRKPSIEEMHASVFFRRHDAG